jgi:ADP-heptose:LPS heptosyltransferase
MPQNILIIGHSNIGDACYDMVVVEPLRRHFPGAKIYFLTSSRCKDMVECHSGIDAVVICDRGKNANSLLGQIRLISELRKIKFDILLVLKRSARHVFLQASEKWITAKDSRANKIHPADRYLNFLETKGITAEKLFFDFSTKSQEQAFCEDFFQKNNIKKGEKIAGILPLAAWSLKSWPMEKWNSLAQALIDRFNLRVISLGKMPESDLGKRVLAAASGDIIMAGNTTLKQAIALIRHCSVFIGPDSSLTHIASCVGVKTIGLYGATSADMFYPYFHRENVVLPETRPDCMPCYPGKRPVCRMLDQYLDFGRCMQDIKVEDVLLKL